MRKSPIGPLSVLEQIFTNDEQSNWWYRIPVPIRMFAGFFAVVIALSVGSLYLYAKHDVETYAANAGWEGRATLIRLEFSAESIVEMHFRIKEFHGRGSYAGWSVRLRQPTYYVSFGMIPKMDP